ncbi:MAG: magnesium transporter [Gammaproteobacteria bacterium]|jgi:magnesium transporter
MRGLLYDPESEILHEGGIELVDQWKEETNTRLWLDFEQMSEQDVERTLLGVLELHPHAVKDAMRARHPPKFERFEGFTLLMVRALDAQTESIDFRFLQVAIMMCPRFLITKRTGQSPNTDFTFDLVRKSPDRLADPVALALSLAARIVRRYVPILLGLEPRLEELEKEIFENPKDDLLAELSSYKSRLTQLRRIFVYHSQVFEELSQHPGTVFPEEQTHEVNDLTDQVHRCQSLAELHYSLVDDLQNGYIAISSHRLNQVMRILTVITVIFVPLSFLAGIYGMNFEVIPELKNPYGYYILLSVMISVALGLLAMFKRKGWL